MYLISVPNLKEIGPQEGCCFGSKFFLISVKNVNKIGQFSEMYISQTTKLIFFKFSMLSRVYGGRIICKFDRN